MKHTQCRSISWYSFFCYLLILAQYTCKYICLFSLFCIFPSRYFCILTKKKLLHLGNARKLLCTLYNTHGYLDQEKMDTTGVLNIDMDTTGKRMKQNYSSPVLPAHVRWVSLGPASESTDLSSPHPSAETGIPDAHITATMQRNRAQEQPLSAARALIREECVPLPPSPRFYH